jgi:predicted membrane protein
MENNWVHVRRRGGWGPFGPLVIIGLGVIFLLAQWNVISVDRAFDYFWPIVLLICGVNCVMRRCASSIVGWIGIVIGAALLARTLGYLHYDLGQLWPVVLIVLGIAMLLRGPRGRRDFAYATPEGSTQTLSGEDHINGVAFLGGIKRQVTRQDFRGGSVTAFLGGFEVDLTRSEIAGDEAVLELSSVFGGGEVRVPTSWVVDVQSQAFLGGYSDETHQVSAVGAKRLVIRGTSVFGGVVIKN